MASTMITAYLSGALLPRQMTLVSTAASIKRAKRVMMTVTTADITTNTPHLHGLEQTSSLQERDHQQCMALVVITVIMMVFWIGAFLGWGPMQLLLEEDGAFEDQCLETKPLPCPA